MPAADEIAHRLARFRQLRDLRVVWPGVAAPAVDRALDEIGRVSAHLLAGSPAPPRLELPPDDAATAFGVAAFLTALGPLLGYWHEQGRLAAPPLLAAVLADHLDHGRRRAARLRGEFDTVLTALRNHGIDVLVLKGGYTAYQYFPEPGTRPASDTDVLIRPGDAEPARRVLQGLGFAEVDSNTLPYSTHWARPGSQVVASLEVPHVDNPWSVDLHASLDRVYPPGVVAHFGEFDIAQGPVWSGLAVPVRVLPQPLLLTHLACHASGDLVTLSLLRLVELVLVIQRDFRAPSQWEALEDLLAETRTGRFAFPSLELAERFVPGTVPPQTRARLAALAPRRLRRRVARTAPATAQSLTRLPLDESSIWAASWREHLTYVLHLVWPGSHRRRMPLRDALAKQRSRIRRLLHALLDGRRGSGR